MIDPEIKKSIDAMDDIPPAVLVPLLDSYMKGALVALTAYEHGGWPGVDALYRDPPASTAQVLHPATKLVPVRDAPHRVTLGEPADPELAGNVLGELQWKIYFELWKSPRAAEASEGSSSRDRQISPKIPHGASWPKAPRLIFPRSGGGPDGSYQARIALLARSVARGNGCRARRHDQDRRERHQRDVDARR